MHCKNCNTPLDASQHQFCYSCGAKVVNYRLTIKHLAQQMGAEVLNVDNTLFRTIKDLIITPETVIDGYIKGMRKRYVNVIQFFAIALTITGLQFFVLKTFFGDPFAFGPELFESSPLIDAESAALSSRLMTELLTTYNGLFNILTIPMSAVISWWVYRIHDKRYNFTEHLVINAYYGAQILIFIAIIAMFIVATGVNYMTFSIWTAPLYFGYYWYIFKRVYGLKFLESIGYIMVFTFFYFIMYFGFTMVISILTALLTHKP